MLAVAEPTVSLHRARDMDDPSPVPSLSVILSCAWPRRQPRPAPAPPWPQACSTENLLTCWDLFPTIASGCSWTLENPDPTKYSLYLRFNTRTGVHRPSPAAPGPLPGQLYRPSPERVAESGWERPRRRRREGAGLELCGGSAVTFLHFDRT